MVLGNAAGECDSSAALTVKKPNILRLLKGLADADLNEGEPIELTAKVEGQPRQVKWYKNGQEISPDARIQLVRLPALLASMRIACPLFIISCGLWIHDA